jgi:hypothetical protein
VYKEYTVEINIPRLLMHNAQTANPLNPFAKALKSVSGKRGKTEADYLEMARIEYEAGLYLNEKREVIIPGRVFEACIAEGARKSKEGKVALTTTIVENDAVITYDGGPLTVEELLDSEAHVLAVLVKVGQAKVMRHRPLFKNVTATFVISLQTELANPSQLERWVVDSLNQVGVGDWRPRYGRGTLDRFAEQVVDLKSVA